MKRRDFAAFALTPLALPAWAKPAAKPSAFAALADRFLEALWQLDPDAAVAAGRFEFAGRLTLPSAAQRQRVHLAGIEIEIDPLDGVDTAIDLGAVADPQHRLAGCRLSGGCRLHHAVIHRSSPV